MRGRTGAGAGLARATRGRERTPARRRRRRNARANARHREAHCRNLVFGLFQGCFQGIQGSHQSVGFNCFRVLAIALQNKRALRRREGGLEWASDVLFLGAGRARQTDQRSRARGVGDALWGVGGGGGLGEGGRGGLFHPPFALPSPRVSITEKLTTRMSSSLPRYRMSELVTGDL